MFDSVRTAWLEAALLEQQAGVSGVYSLGNPGPSIGKLTRLQSDTVSLVFMRDPWSDASQVREAISVPKMRCHPSWCSSTSHGEKQPDTDKVQRLRAEVADLNSFFRAAHADAPGASSTWAG